MTSWTKIVMDAGGFQQLGLSASGHGKTNPASSQSSGGARFHRSHSRGGYKQLHESREGWQDTTLSQADPPRGSVEPAPPPWFSRTPSQGSLSGSSATQGGFMLASNISSGQQQVLSHSTSSSSSLTPHSHLPPSSSLSVSPSNSSPSQHHETAPPLLWGEVGGEEEEEGEEGGKWPRQSLWQEGWRAEGVVCSVPRLHQHHPHSQSYSERSSLQSLLQHPRDSHGHNPVLHSTDLQYHIREVEHIRLMSGANFRPSNLPPLPETFGSSKVKKVAHNLPSIPPTSLNLDPSSVALLLRKSTAAICCHAGYHSTSLRALDTLAGVMGDFISRLCKQLRIHSDQQQDCGPTAHQMNIQDPLEQSLWACGIRGRAELHQFWKTEVEADLQQLQRKAMKLHEEPIPSSLPPPPPLSRPPSLDLSLWPTEPEKIDDEISLEEALNTNMDIVVPTTTPDPGGAQMFLPEVVSHEPEDFVLLTPDLPARKRSRTSSLLTE